MAVAVEAVGIVPAVIVAFEFEKLRASGVGAGQAEGEHGGLAARIGEAHHFGGGNHAAEALGRFSFGGRSGGEVRSFRDGLGDHVDDLRMSVAMNERAERHHEIDVLVTVDIPHLGAAAAFEDHGTGRVDSGAARGRVHAFDQGLLGAGEVFAGAGAGCGVSIQLRISFSILDFRFQICDFRF